MLDDDSPTLGVNFAIDAGGSYDSLLRVERAMDATESKLLGAAARIERGTSNMVSSEAAVAKVSAFGNAATRVEHDIRREKAQTAKEIERTIRLLDREAASAGKTRDQKLADKVTELAVAAARQGNTDATDRLYASARRLKAVQTSLAEDKLEAETKAQAAASRERELAERALHATLLERSRLEAALARTMGTDRPRATDAGATFSALGARAAEEEARALREAAFAHQQFEAAARRGMEAMRERERVARATAAAEAELAREAAQVRAALDPMFAAQQRFDAELDRADRLLKAGAISQREYAQATQFARDNLFNHAQAVAGSGTAMETLGQRTAQQRMAMQQLGFQLNDVSSQYAAGTNASMIFAQQSGQVIQALQMMSTTGTGVLGFLASWQGAVVSAIAIAAIPFIARLVESNNALDQAAEKLRKDAQQTEVTGKAKAAFAMTVEGLTQAIRDNQKATDQLIDSDKTAAQQALDRANANLVNLRNTRAQTEETLRLAKATIVLNEARADVAAQDPRIAGPLREANNSILARIDQMTRDMATSAGLLATAEREVTRNLSLQVVERAEMLADPLQRIREQYEGPRGLIEMARRQATAEEVRNGTLSRQVQLLKTRERVEIEAEQRRQSAARGSGSRDADTLTPSAVSRMLRDALPGVHITSTTGGKHAANSFHYRGQAVDFVPKGGMGSMTKEDVRRIFSSRGIDVVELLGPGDKGHSNHFHVAWTKGKHALDEFADAARRAREEARELARDERGVFASVRTAIDDFAPVSDLDAQRRAMEEAKRHFRTMFGDEDPFGDAVADTADALQAKWENLAQEQMDRQLELQNHLRLTADLSNAAGDALANAFGRAGGAIGNVVGILGQYKAEETRIAQSQLSYADKARAATALQLDSMLGLTSAAKTMFAEQSAGYRALEAAEKALAVVRAVQTARDVAAGAARMFASLGPAGFAAVGAMAAVMAGFGFSGGFSSGKAPPPTNTGTGTVLGDPKAQSDSIKRAIDQLREVDTLMLSHSREMAASLRSIDRQIGGFAAQILKAGNINASAGVQTGFKTDTTGKVLSTLVDPTGLFSKIPVIGGVFGAVKSLIGSLFGSKTTITGTGLYGGAQSLGGILSSGFDASYYSDIKKEKKFFGIKTGTSYSTQFTGADPTLENQFTLILRSFNDAIGAAAGPLGESTAAIEQRLSGFIVNIGKIDLTGLTGEQITERLTAVFGAAADQMAGAAFPGVAKWQKAGEGLFETAVRVASTVEAVTGALGSLGAVSQAMSIDAKLGLAAQFDSVGELTSAAEAYFERFYSKEERARARLAQFGDVFASLGLTLPSSLASYRQLVEAQNLTTEAGQETYATLLRMAPAFAELQEAMNGAKSAADVLAERQDLERKLLELRGDTAAIRALDLAKLDASNRALQQQVWAVQDAQEAARAAEALRDAWRGVGDSIMDEVKRIRGLNTAEGGSFASLQGRFNAATLAARGGDQDAAKSLPGLSQALLAQAALAATSRQELDRVQAATAASLEATKRAIDAMTAAPSAAASTATLLAAAAATQATAAPAAANDDREAEVRALREELAAMRRDMNSGLAAVAGHTGKLARTLDDVTADSGGTAVSVAAAA
jgi:hypothetical protein